MSHDVPNSSVEQVKEAPSILRVVFEGEGHNILGGDNLEVTSKDVEEFNGLVAGASSVEEIRAVRQGFSDQFDQAGEERDASETTGPRRRELKELMIKLLHKIAVGEAAIMARESEPRGRRYDDRRAKNQLKNLEDELAQSTSGEKTDQIQDQMKALRKWRVLNKQKLEEKMSTMDPIDRQRLDELDRQDADISLSMVDLEKRREEQERMYKEGMLPDFRAVYEPAMDKLNKESVKVGNEIINLEAKYNI